jgi:hypothetical protein
MDTIPLRDAYRALLDAAATVARSGDPSPLPPTGEWNADQILAHVAIVNAATIAAVSAIASGANTTYDNRIALDTWTIERVIALAGGNAGLRDRIRLQADALCTLGGPVLSEAELNTLVPTRLLSPSWSISPYRCETSSPASQKWSCPATPNSSSPSCRAALGPKQQRDLPARNSTGHSGQKP